MGRTQSISYDTSTCPCCGGTVSFPCGSCSNCTEQSQPYEVDVTISGIANAGCADCTDLNKVWRTILSNGSYYCLFEKVDTAIACLPAYDRVGLTVGGGSLSVQVSSAGGSGSATMEGTWSGAPNCNGINSASSWTAPSPNPTSPCDFTNLSIDGISIVSYVTLPATLTASLTSSCPGLDGVSITLTYNSGTLRWEGTHDFGDGSGPQDAFFTCADEVDAVAYIFEITNATCSGNTASSSTLSYHPFSWGPYSMSNSGCIPASCAAGSYTLEVTVTE